MGSDRVNQVVRTWNGRRVIGLVVLATCVCAATLKLGFWQLARAEQKDAWRASFVAAMGSLPVLMPEHVLQRVGQQVTQPAFTRVQVSGTYRDEHYLVDNRVHQGRVGYWLVSRFDSIDGRTLLINRGWIPAPGHRDEPVDVATPSGVVNLTGILWPDMGLPPLHGDDFWDQAWPKRIQRLNIARMATVDDRSVVPVEVRLEAGNPGVEVAAPMQFSIDGDRHRGYAVQWFGLSAAAIVCFAGLALRKKPRALPEAGES